MKFIKRNLLPVFTLVILVCSIIIGAAYLNGLSEELRSPSLDTEGDVIYDTTNDYSVNISNEGNDVSFSAAKGLRSSVSIYCTFKTSSGGVWPWNPYPNEQTYYTAGSGVIYKLEEDGSAFIITNYHVVYDANSNSEDGISEKIYVYLYGKESEQYSVEATFIGGSPNYDIAILRVEKSDVLAAAYNSGVCSEVEMANSDSIHPGDIAIAIGNPSSSTELGGISVTQGIVSVDSEYITMTGANENSQITYRVIRVDTPINSGNSGGGLFNSEGKMIGIVNAKVSSSDIENIGYAIPSNIVRAVADNIIDYCCGTDCKTVLRCMLGITIKVSALDTYYDTENGVLCKVEEIEISEINPDGLASSKLRTGDIIKNVILNGNNVNITRQHHLADTLLDARVGDEITFIIERDGTELNVSITINEDCLVEY